MGKSDITTLLETSAFVDTPFTFDEKLREYRQEWTDGMLTNTMMSGKITEEDLQKPIIVLMDVHSIFSLKIATIKHPLGIIFNHALLTERESDMITLETVYSIDTTKNSTIRPIGRPYNVGQIGTVEFCRLVRRMTFQDNISISISMSKSVFERVTESMRLLTSQRFLEKTERKYVGQNETDPLDDPEAKMRLYELNTFFNEIEQKYNAASNSLTGTHTQVALIKLALHSPFIFHLPRHVHTSTRLSRADYYMNQQASSDVMTFGLNKLDYVRPEMRNSTDYLEAFYNTYLTNTDNATTHPDQLATITLQGGEPFVPKAVLICLPHTFKFLNHQKLIKSTYANINQYMTKISLKMKDFNPLNERALQDGVTLKGNHFVKDPKGGMLRDEYKTSHKINTIKIANDDILVVPLDQGTVTKETQENSSLKSLCSFDTMLPQGAVLTDTGDCSDVVDLHQTNLYPTKISFLDHHGQIHTMPEIDFESDGWREFVTSVFHPKNVFTGDTRTGIELFDDVGRLKYQQVYEGGDAAACYDDGVIRGEEFKPAPHHALKNIPESFLFFSEIKVPETDRGVVKSYKKRAISLNPFVIDNCYYDFRMFIDNVIRCWLNFDQFQKLMLSYIEKVEIRDKKTAGLPETSGSVDLIEDEWNLPEKFPMPQKYTIKRGDFEFLVNNDEIFSMEALREYPHRRAYTNDKLKFTMKEFASHFERYSLSNSKLNMETIAMVATIVASFPNAGYSVVPNMLNFIRPGWSINWHMENVVEQEGMIMAQPGSFMNATTIPFTKKQSHNNAETNIVDYIYNYNTAVHKASLNYGAVVDPNAILVKYLTRATAYRVGPVDLWKENKYELAKIRGMLYEAEEEYNTPDDDRVVECSPWIPLIAPPYQSVGFWGGTGQSPVGRLNGHYQTENEFNRRFFDENENDIKFKNCYTKNKVWTNMRVNINTVFMLPPTLANSPLFFLHKYTHFNPTTATGVNQVKTNLNRLAKSHLFDGSDDDGTTRIDVDQHTLMKQISLTRGVSFVKHCATTEEQLSPVLLLEGKAPQTTGVFRHPKVTKNSADYRITGSTTLEKFDKTGVNHYSFY